METIQEKVRKITKLSECLERAKHYRKVEIISKKIDSLEEEIVKIERSRK